MSVRTTSRERENGILRPGGLTTLHIHIRLFYHRPSAYIWFQNYISDDNGINLSRRLGYELEARRNPDQSDGWTTPRFSVKLCGRFTVVGEAGNGKEAIELYPSLKPDIITMDVTMPIMDGLQAASVIKKLDANQKILMLSAMSDKDIIAEAATYGIKHFCSKPFKPQQMVQKILEALEK